MRPCDWCCRANKEHTCLSPASVIGVAAKQRNHLSRHLADSPTSATVFIYPPPCFFSSFFSLPSPPNFLFLSLHTFSFHSEPLLHCSKCLILLLSLSPRGILLLTVRCFCFDTSKPCPSDMPFESWTVCPRILPWKIMQFKFYVTFLQTTSSSPGSCPLGHALSTRMAYWNWSVLTKHCLCSNSTQTRPLGVLEMQCRMYSRLPWSNAVCAH